MSLFPLYDPSKDYSGGFMQAVAAARKPITGTLTAIADLPVSKRTAMQLINNLIRNLPKLKTNRKIPVLLGLQKDLNSTYENWLASYADSRSSEDFMDDGFEYSTEEAEQLLKENMQPDPAFVEAVKSALEVFPYKKGEHVVLESRVMRSTVIILDHMLFIDDLMLDGASRHFSNAADIRKCLRWNGKPIESLNFSSLGAVLTKGPIYKNEKGGRGIAP